ncbi:MAG: methionine sulfoxide reductase heme-binding subunit [Thermoleophilaceae bacterium]|nr:methionine sulfoxide reductase heme-binding subunit [Thermoleophilaceae bacterium]
MSSNAPLDHAWWLASRSAGVVAFLLLTTSVVLGLAMALRLAPRNAVPALRKGHERVAIASLAAIGAHGTLLLGDPWLHPGLSGLLVPFAMSYRAVWTGLGVCAGYLAAALSLSYYPRRRIGARRWRNAHRLIPIAWVLATAHVIGSGTDGSQAWLLIPLTAAGLLVIVMLLYRLGTSLAGGSATARPAR